MTWCVDSGSNGACLPSCPAGSSRRRRSLLESSDAQPSPARPAPLGLNASSEAPLSVAAGSDGPADAAPLGTSSGAPSGLDAGPVASGSGLRPSWPRASHSRSLTAAAATSCYSWSQVSGPGTATFVNASSLSSTVLAAGLVPGATYTFRLTVTDDVGDVATSAVSVVYQPTVSASPPPSPPSPPSPSTPKSSPPPPPLANTSGNSTGNYSSPPAPTPPLSYSPPPYYFSNSTGNVTANYTAVKLSFSYRYNCTSLDFWSVALLKSFSASLARNLPPDLSSSNGTAPLVESRALPIAIGHAGAVVTSTVSFNSSLPADAFRANTALYLLANFFNPLSGLLGVPSGFDYNCSSPSSYGNFSSSADLAAMLAISASW